MGCNLTVRNCDISSSDAVAEFAAECSQSFPPVRGVIVAAMVLDVSPHFPR